MTYKSNEQAKLDRLTRGINHNNGLMSKLVLGLHGTNNQNVKKATEIKIDEISMLLELLIDSESETRELLEYIKLAFQKVSKGKLVESDIFVNDVLSRYIIHLFVKGITITNDEIAIEYF